MPTPYFRSIPSVLVGNTHTVNTIAEFDAAYAAVTSGVDSKIIMNAGTYGDATGTMFNRSIAKSKLQIVAASNATRVRIEGSWTIPSGTQDVWLIGLEFTEEAVNAGDRPGGATGIDILGAIRTSIINCYIHDYDSIAVLPGYGHNCILDNADSVDTLIYGSILTNSRHVLYCQNATGSIKHYVRSYFGDVKLPFSSNAYCIHGYSSTPTKVQNMEWLDSIVANGRATHGSDGSGSPSQEICKGLVWDGCILFRSALREFTRINECQFTNNRVYETTGDMPSGTGNYTQFDWQMYHGANEATFGYGAPHKYKDNLIYKPDDTGDTTMNLRACHYDGAGVRQQGTAGTALRANAVEPDVGPNTYYGFFRASVTTNGTTSSGITGIAAWQSATSTRGNQWDTGSTLTAGSPPDYYRIIENEYDSDRAMLFVWNSDESGTVAVTLPRRANIYNITDPWGTAVHTDVLTPSIALQANNGKAGIFLIKYTGGTDVQFAVPNATTNNPDGVTDLGGGTTNIYTNIDETTANDADGIRSVLGPTNDIVVFKLSNVTDPVTSTGHIFVTRYGKDQAGGAQIDITSQLRLSYVNEGSPGTAIVTRTFTNVSDTLTTDSYGLSAGETDAITDYTALYARLVFNQV